jgi:CO/xanthine dehydrogenase Mo-binding subunit
MSSAPAQAEETRLGDSVARSDGIPKVTGTFAYASDLELAGMLYGTTVRSPHAHALIRSIDIGPALALSGVHAVLTQDDVPGKQTFGIEFADQPVLASGRVRFYGEPVAIVAADSIEQARRAAAAVEVDYEMLPLISDVEEALGQEPIHEGAPTAGHGYREDPRPNVARHVLIEHGDPDATGDVRVEGYYEIGMQDQAFLGPEAGVAIPDGQGGVDIHTATQSLHHDRDQIAPCLDKTSDEVRVHVAGIGGAFGGREDVSMQIHAALLALHTDRAVRMVFSREESFVGHPHRHPARIWMEHHATRIGELVAVRARILLDGGAYCSTTAAVTSNAACFAPGPYRVPNARVEGTGVYTNNPPCGAMRGFGVVQTCFAAEAQMDRLAAELGIDPVELRLLNAMGPGDTLITGQVMTGSFPVAEVIRRAAALPVPEPEALPRDVLRLPGGSGNTTRGEGVKRGIGFAVGMKNNCYSEGYDDYTAARVQLHADGSALVHCAVTDVGQGADDLVRRVAQEELGTDDVSLAPPSTVDVGSAGSSSASRMAWMSAGAVQLACQAALAERERTGNAEVDVERVYRHPETVPLDPETGQTTGERSHVAIAITAARVVVEVDTELGIPRATWIGAAQDVGRALNPQAVEGQIEGGTIQGLGLALMEEIQTDGGVIRNANFTDYLLPTILDVPPIATEIVEDTHPEAPYGMKGVGETSTVTAPAAVAAALRNATDQPLTRIPVSLDDLIGL